MKNYELTVVFHPDLEMNLDPALDKVKKIIESAGGQILKEENEGKKRLAYTIKGQDFGIYDFFTVTLPPEGPSKVESTFNITDEVLRHMLLREDPRRIRAAADRKSNNEADESAKESNLTTEKGE